ncbi:MFS transporter [Herbiconiux sp. A18JL235]|uniref:MFS transporter n=1 Tax=Herbiconiux sp. A18JL235 TaxID=3152363 RepID=A0AB39BFZ6_9MICO
MSFDEAAPRRSGWLLDLAPLRESPAYARFWVSGVASGVGTQLTAVAIGIHVYTLTGSTASVALVGGLALLPMVAMGVFGGSLVDAFDRRKVLIVASSVSFIAPVGIAALAWSNVETPWPYYVFTTLSSTVGALVGAARFAIHPRLVERRLLPAVAALSGVSAGVQSAVGPALAGVLVATVGFAWTYSLDVVLFVIGFWGIVSLPPIVPAGATRPGLAAIVDGLRFLRTARNIRTAIGLQVAAFAFGRSYAILPAVGALVVGGSAWTVGLLTAAGAVGVILSGLLSGPLGGVRRHGRAIMLATSALAVAVAALGLLLLAFGTRPDAGDSPEPVDIGALLALCAVLAVAGAADNVAGIFRTTMMQSATPDAMRGRLQGLFTLVLTAGPRLGDVFAGFLAALGALWFPPLLGAVLIGAVVAAYLRTRPAFRAYDAEDPTP